MGIGTTEIAFLLVVAVATLVATVVYLQRTTLVLAVFCLIAVLVSPADLMSTLLIAVPNCLLYLFATGASGRGVNSHVRLTS